jgi:hypothetical protein
VKPRAGDRGSTPVRRRRGRPPLCSPKVPSRLHGRLMARPVECRLWRVVASGAAPGPRGTRQRAPPPERQRGRTGRSYLSLGSSLSLSQTQSHDTRARTHIILQLKTTEQNTEQKYRSARVPPSVSRSDPDSKSGCTIPTDHMTQSELYMIHVHVACSRPHRPQGQGFCPSQPSTQTPGSDASSHTCPRAALLSPHTHTHTHARANSCTGLLRMH